GPARDAAHGQWRAAIAAELLTVRIGCAAARALHAPPDRLETVSVSQFARLVGQNEARQHIAQARPRRKHINADVRVGSNSAIRRAYPMSAIYPKADDPRIGREVAEVPGADMGSYRRELRFSTQSRRSDIDSWLASSNPNFRRRKKPRL